MSGVGAGRGRGASLVGPRGGRRGALAAVLLASALAAPAGAQVSASAVIRGEVRDSAGAPVPGAEVSLRAEGAGGALVRRGVTDSAGRFVLVGLPAGGPYELTVQGLGLSPSSLSSLHLAAGESRRVDVRLTARPVALPGITAAVAGDMIFSGTRTGAATVLEERALESAPLVDRNITALSVLSPLVAVQGDALSVAGQNARFNALRVDGALSGDAFGLSPNGVPGGHANAKPLPLDAVRQYAVLVAPYDVRHSGFTGGLLSVATRQGGESWTGSGFVYYRDAAFGPPDAGSELIGADDRGTEADLRTELAGLTTGGPLGRARVFVAAELERRRRPLPGMHIGAADPRLLRVDADSVAAMATILEERYGLDAGSTGAYPLENPLANLFARVDVPVAGDHDLTTRYNFISAEDDLPVRHLGFDAYQLGSLASRVESHTHALTARLASRFGERTENEVLVNVQRTADATVAATEAPLVEVRLRAAGDGGTFAREVQAGGDPLANRSRLDQAVVQVADNLSHTAGDHLLTVGADGTYFGMRRKWLPASRGIWRFDGVGALAANAPSSFERLVLTEGADPDVEVSLLQLAGYLQDEWRVSGTLTLTLGLRLDLPLALSRPGYNRDAALVTGIVTDRPPAGAPLFSPRVGFNWSPRWTPRTQLRGGAGVFTGLPPLAWIVDAYANTGLRTAFLRCEGAAAPALDVAAAPTTCADGAEPGNPELVFFADDFRFPQDLRVSVGVDRALPWGLVATVEALYTRALHQVAIEDLNLGPTVDDSVAGIPEALGNRPLFGLPRLIPDRFGIMEPGLRWGAYGRVLRIGNRSRNAALAVAVELQRRFTDRLDLRLAYTHNRGVDTRSLLHPDAALNYGMTAIRADPARPEVAPTAFDRPHRVVGSVRARLAGWGEGLDAMAVYVGQSGLPYSYVFESDMNGDGFPGPGVAQSAYNDLFYMPASPAEVPAAIVSTSMIFQLAALEGCLGEAQGRIVARNACRTPWSNRLDLRLSQELRTPLGEVRLTADLMNALNLLSDEWGLVHTVPPVVPIFRIERRAGCPGLGCALGNPVIGAYTGPRRLDSATGLAVAARPYVRALPDSHWRAQLGVRISF